MVKIACNVSWQEGGKGQCWIKWSFFYPQQSELKSNTSFTTLPYPEHENFVC